MEHDQPPSERVDELIGQLRARVEERRRQGAYPPGLEDDLDAHFRRIAAHRVVPDLDELKTKLTDLDARSRFGPDRIPVGSHIPGGDVLHRSVSKVVARQTQGILEQVQAFADGVREVLHRILAAIEDPYGHVHADLVGQIDGIFERLTGYERGPADSAAAVVDLRARVEQLEAAESRRRFRPPFSSERFEDEFRGTTDELRERYQDLARHFEECAPVLDIGCGRGEFLDLLRDVGVEAAGVEIDAELVKMVAGRGLEVHHGDGLAVLEANDDGSLGGISLIQVVEHLSPQELVELVSLAADKLRPGGKMLVETINPQSLYVFAHSFYVDPTHAVPVHPAYLAFLIREAGFAELVIDWRSPPPPEDVLGDVGGDGALGEAVNENVRRLNRLLFAPQDYAIVATR